MSLINAALLDAISRAPSAHNTQPWKIKFGDNSLTLYLDKNRMIEAIDEKHIEAAHCIGAVLENIVLTLAHLGMTAEYNTADKISFIEPVVTIKWNTSSQRSNSNLYQQIPLRRTSRDAYLHENIDHVILNKLKEQCTSKCKLHFLTDPDDIENVRQLVTQATMIQFEDKAIVHELYKWLRFTRKDKLWFQDGLNAECMAWGKIKAFLSRIILKPTILNFLANTNLHKTLLSNKNDHSPYAPVICLLVVSNDNFQNRVEAGRSLQRIWLKASQLGYVTHPISAAVDIPLTRHQTKKLFSVGEKMSHVTLFRLGKTNSKTRSQRLPMDSMIQR